MPRLIPINQAARELSVSTDTIRRLIRAKRIPSVRVARRVMIPTEAIERVARKGTNNQKRGTQ
jgi:excisionase family DNA binding protein